MAPWKSDLGAKHATLIEQVTSNMPSNSFSLTTIQTQWRRCWPAQQENGNCDAVGIIASIFNTRIVYHLPCFERASRWPFLRVGWRFLFTLLSLLLFYLLTDRKLFSCELVNTVLFLFFFVRSGSQKRGYKNSPENPTTITFISLFAVQKNPCFASYWGVE